MGSYEVSRFDSKTLMSFSLFILALTLTCASEGTAAPLDELIAGAKKEGVINVHAPSNIGPQGAQELGAAFNKKYRLNIKLNYFPSSSFTTDTAKVISHSLLGVAPDWDVITLTENNHAELWQKKLHLPFNYKALGVDSRAIQHDGGTIAISHGPVLPAYSKNVLAVRDVPKSWDQLLDPKWRDGKLGVADTTYYFAPFAAGPWGEERTTGFVKKLAEQRPVLGRLNELAVRLQLGEILVAVMLAESTVHNANSKGAPIAFAEQVEPVLVSVTNIGVLKGAAHPNVAHLFTAFMVSLEAQDLWEKYFGGTSALTPGTKTYRFLKGKKVVLQGGQDPDTIQKLSNEYSRILGFTR
jgi:ABC-type Fe3+ transport system substrate-binding protein